LNSKESSVWIDQRKENGQIAMNVPHLKCMLCALVLAMARDSQAQLVNGDFETGDFTGWVLYTTPDGGLGDPQVVPFDTAGTGTPSFSAQFEVGQTSGQIGGGPSQGGGILQHVTLGSGQLVIHLDIAAESVAVNGDGGTFRLLLDGLLVDSYAFGGIGIMGEYGSVPETKRSALSFSGAVEAGTHEIAIEIIRVGGNLPGVTPYEYLDNIVLSGTAVPEPSAPLFAAMGLVALAVEVRRRQTNKSRVGSRVA
jgi:hypothetical protein